MIYRVLAALDMVQSVTFTVFLRLRERLDKRLSTMASPVRYRYMYLYTGPTGQWTA